MKTILSVLLLASSLCAADFYVDQTGGSDSNAGTSTGAAWKTVAKVVAHTAPCFAGDDIIHFKKGETWNEILAVPCSGTSGHPIIFTNYGTGALPLFNLASPTPRASCVTSSSKSYFTIDGIQCANPTGPHINITTSAGVTVQNNTLLNTAANHGIAFNGVTTTAQVLGNTIQDGSGQPAGGTGITCTSGATCTGIVVSGNTVTRFGDVRKFGIILYDADGASVHDNIVTLNDIGIQLHTAHATVNSANIFNNQVLDTKLYASGDGEGMELTGCAPGTASVCPSPDAANSFLVTASVYNNYFANPNTANASDALGAVVQANILVYGNIIQGPAVYGFHASSGCNGGKFYNNTFYNISNTAILIDQNCLSSDLKNNVVHTAVNHCIFAHATATGGTEDYNICYNSGSKSGFSGGTHDKTTDPMFLTTPPTLASHFKLQSSSPARDAGATLGAPYATAAFNPNDTSFPFSTTDQGSSGAAWEMGAFAWVTPLGPSLVFYETDNTTQTGRPITRASTFTQGEYPQCMQPVVAGTPISSYQIDVKNRWPDGSVKFAIYSFIAPTFTSGGNFNVTFDTSASCNNTGFLTQAQMGSFNTGGGGSGWGADVQVTANSTTVTLDAKAMLAADDPAGNTFNDCKNNYFLKGPVATKVIVQDCTATFSQDFGWTFTKATPPVMSTACTKGSVGTSCSIHGSFEVSFYPGPNYNTSTNTCSGSDRTCAVKIDYILENDYPDRSQDQVLTNVVWHTGASPSAKLTRNCGRVLTNVGTTASSTAVTSATGFVSGDVGCPIYITGAGLSGAPLTTVIKSLTNSTTVQVVKAASLTKTNAQTYINDLYSGSRWIKTFWSGTAPGAILVDPDWPYLIATKAFPYYDLTRTVDPTTDFTNFMTGDRGDLGGGGVADGPNSTWGSNVRLFRGNTEGAPVQRQDLLYLFNANSCGTANGKCAKAWYILTGEAGARDASMVSAQPYAITGGGGQWRAWANVAGHYRESRNPATGKAFFCPGYDKNSVPSTACGASTPNGVGKTLSRHAHPSSQWHPTYQSTPTLPDSLTTVGTRTLGGWDIEDCSHWQNFSYVPYILTGEHFYLEEQYMAASFCLASLSGNPGGGESNGYYGYINPSPTQPRWFAWGNQEVARAAFLAPDGTAEASYYLNMLNSNLEVQEGFLGITGTALTPTVTNPTLAGFDGDNANRWDWGRGVVQAECYNRTSAGTVGDCSPTAPPIAATLHTMTTGQCTTAGTHGYIDLTKSKVVGSGGPWADWYIGIVLSHIIELGYTQATSVATVGYQRLIEQVNNGVLDAYGNPYLVAMYNDALRDLAGGHTCTNGGITDRDPYFTDWQSARGALVSAAQNVNTFAHGGANADPPWTNFPCEDHSYQLLARAHSTYTVGIASTDHTCNGGAACSGASAQAWLFSNTPYFDISPADGRSPSCGSSDKQIPFALAVRPGGAPPPPGTPTTGAVPSGGIVNAGAIIH